MLKFSKHSGIYQLRTQQTINANLEDVWAYFSQPQNLDFLTPPNMDFKITSEELKEMYVGQIIAYSIEILPKIRQHWITEITVVKDKVMFVDEQRFGPYKMWHHEHHFHEHQAGEVIMNDIVSYKLPMGIMGNLVAGNLIKNRLKKIFEYRFEKVNEIFR